MKTIKCIIACVNANGEPDLYFCKVRATQEQIEGCFHLDCAIEQANEEGYEAPFVPYDEHDKAGKALCKLFEWKTASLFDIDLNIGVE